MTTNTMLPPSKEPTWRELAAALRARGLPRNRSDTRATMRARLEAADRAAATAHVPLRLAPALTGPADTLDGLAPTLAQFGARRVAREAALLPPARVDAFLGAARRHGLPVGEDAITTSYPAEVPPALWAAARFVRDLGQALGWRADLLPHDLDAVPAPIDPGAARQADALLRAWTAALDAWRDPLAEQTAAAPSPLPTEEKPAPVLDQVMEVVREALVTGARLRIRYAGRARGAVTERVVEPRAIERFRGRDLLRAWCELRRAERCFRLDRIVAAHLLTEASAVDSPPSTPSPDR